MISQQTAVVSSLKFVSDQGGSFNYEFFSCNSNPMETVFYFIIIIYLVSRLHMEQQHGFLTLKKGISVQ